MIKYHQANYFKFSKMWMIINFPQRLLIHCLTDIQKYHMLLMDQYLLVVTSAENNNHSFPDVKRWQY